MRAFAAAWPDRAIVQEPLAQIPWYHHLALLEKLDDPADRLWYARQALEQGWSHNILVLLCREKNRIVVEYALRNLKRPIGVAEWETKIVEKLPKRLAGSLPTVEEIEAELGVGRGKRAKRVKG